MTMDRSGCGRMWDTEWQLPCRWKGVETREPARPLWCTRHSGSPTVPSPPHGRKWNGTRSDGSLRAMTQPQTALPPSVRWRAGAAAVAGVVAAAFVYALYARQTRSVISDWDPTWAGTRALLQGQSPYAAIQVPPWPNY